MNKTDKDFLKHRIGELSSIISSNHTLPKEERNDIAIVDAKKRIGVISHWLGIHPQHAFYLKNAESMVKPARIPDATMTIDTIEQLEQAWPNIKGKNIAISAPPEVGAAMKILTKQWIKSEERRFYVEKPWNTRFMGIDDQDQKWDCYLKLNSRRKSRALIELCKRLMIPSLENWKNYEIILY